MNNINICEMCQKAYEPEEIGNVRRLRTFKGFTIDLRLKQFRKAEIDKSLEFIEFDSSKGRKLLAEMHMQVIN